MCGLGRAGIEAVGRCGGLQRSGLERHGRAVAVLLAPSC